MDSQFSFIAFFGSDTYTEFILMHSKRWYKNGSNFILSLILEKSKIKIFMRISRTAAFLNIF